MTNEANDPGLFEIMYSCRAMRRLENTPVPRELLVKLVDAANHGPSGSNMQGARWVIVQDQEQKQKLAELKKLAATTVIGNSNPPTLPNPAGADSSALTFYHHHGCDACSNTGYRGRIGIFELMLIDEPVRREILNNSDAKTIQRVAQQQGMRLLREDGARQVVAGVTSVEEVLAATQAAEV